MILIPQELKHRPRLPDASKPLLSPCPFPCYRILSTLSPQPRILYSLLIAIWLKCPFFGGNVSGQSLLPLADWAKVYIPHSAPVCMFSGYSHTVILCLGRGRLHLPSAVHLEMMQIVSSDKEIGKGLVLITGQQNSFYIAWQLV